MQIDKCVIAVVATLVAAVLSFPLVVAQEYSLNFGERIGTLVRDRKYKEAEEVLKSEENPDPWVLAWLQLHQGRIDEGVKSLQKLVPEVGDNRVPVIRQILALVGDASVEKAFELNKKYLQDPTLADDPTLRFTLLQFYLRKNEVGEAKKIASQLLAGSLDGPERKELRGALLNIAIRLYEMKQPAEAIAYLDTLHKRNPETKFDPEVQFQYAAISVDLKPLTAIRLLDDIQRSDPEYATRNMGMMLLVRANAYFALSSLDEAAKDYQKIIDGSVANPEFKSMVDIAKAQLQEIDVRKNTNSKVAVVDNLADNPHSKGSDVGFSYRKLFLMANVAIIAILALAVWLRRHRKAALRGN